MIAKYDPEIPLCPPSAEEISKQMRINVDILKKELTEHIDKELKRFREELKEIKEKEVDE